MLLSFLPEQCPIAKEFRIADAVLLRLVPKVTTNVGLLMGALLTAPQKNRNHRESAACFSNCKVQIANFAAENAENCQKIAEKSLRLFGCRQKSKRFSVFKISQRFQDAKSIRIASSPYRVNKINAPRPNPQISERIQTPFADPTP